MNEKFKELAEQTNVSFGEGMEFAVVFGELKDFEKFAELIVKECAKFMDENSGYNDSDGCWFPEPEDMLKHFGVEK